MDLSALKLERKDPESEKCYYIVGLARSGLALVRKLLEQKIPVVIFDDRITPEKLLQEGLSQVPFQAPEEVDWMQVAALILSPGIPHLNTNKVNAHQAALRAQAHNVPILSDIELFGRCIPQSQIIAVTGTNGKSTVAAMLAHFLKELKVPVRLGGNIGYPVFELEPLPEGEGYYVIECSSYQLERTTTFKPQFIAWTNMSEDHLDRHGDLESYVAAKKHLFELGREGYQKIVMGLDDLPSKQVFEALKKSFQNADKSVLGVSFKAQHDVRFVASPEGVKDLETGAFYLLQDYTTHRGKVYALNFADVLGIFAHIGRLEELLHRKDEIKPYEALEHRQEYIGDITIGHHPIQIINDSKATNSLSTLAALEAYDNVTLLLGGIAKSTDLTALKPYFTKIEQIVLFGQARFDFANSLSDLGYTQFKVCEDLKEAIAFAFETFERNSSQGDCAVGDAALKKTLLFSPACASFDQFKDYADRGAAFKKLVLPYLVPKECG